MSGNDASFGEWLLQQLERRDWTQADFSRLGKFTSTNVSRWINNDRVPSTQSCLRIASVFQIDEDLVLRVAGHKPQLAATKPARSFDDILRELAAERPIAVPIIEQIASAGQGESAIGYVYLPPLGRRRPGLFAMRVRGQCMAPKIEDGDTIIVDRDAVAEIGKLVVAVAGEHWDQVLVKRLVDRNGTRWLQPNEGAPIPVNDAVRIVGVVIQIIIASTDHDRLSFSRRYPHNRGRDRCWR